MQCTPDSAPSHLCEHHDSDLWRKKVLVIFGIFPREIRCAMWLSNAMILFHARQHYEVKLDHPTPVLRVHFISLSFLWKTARQTISGVDY
jgi:hypothetical protein